MTTFVEHECKTEEGRFFLKDDLAPFEERPDENDEICTSPFYAHLDNILLAHDSPGECPKAELRLIAELGLKFFVPIIFCPFCGERLDPTSR